MPGNRYQDNRETRWSVCEPTHEDPTLIVCPKCTSMALVVPSGENAYNAVCNSCGFAKEESGDRNGFWWHNDNPTDGYLGYNLWLQTSCLGHSLWVFNIRHLEILESYVGANLRARKNDEQWGWQNSSLTSRLPKWMKNGKNREEILKCLQKLREKV